MPIAVRYATEADKRTIRGLRNNNPLNIRHNPANKWVGQAPEQKDREFVTFVSMPYGIRAAVVILMNYWDKRGLRTVREMIATWAPSSENDTDAYVRQVCLLSGLKANDTANVYDPDTLFALLDAMIVVECGVRLPASVIREGMALAGPRRPPKLHEVPATTTGKAVIGVSSALTIGASVVTAAAEQVDHLSLETQVLVLVILAVVAVIAAFVWRSRRD
jgi:hypothetical protein